MQKFSLIQYTIINQNVTKWPNTYLPTALIDFKRSPEKLASCPYIPKSNLKALAKHILSYHIHKKISIVVVRQAQNNTGIYGHSE